MRGKGRVSLVVDPSFVDEGGIEVGDEDGEEGVVS
jgi:hypothetical protein